MQAEDVEREYQRRLAAYPEARWGWSFMYTPEAALKSAKVVLVGLNPGGNDEDQQSSWEHDGINAYVDQPWGKGKRLNPLQQQVGLLFAALGVRPDEVFAANLLPFRSPSWRELPGKEGALEFGRRLWKDDLLPRTPARLFVCIGKQPGQELAALLGAASPPMKHEVEWGKQSLDEYVAPDGRTVLALPHLSRFRVFDTSRTLAAATVGRVAKRVLR